MQAYHWQHRSTIKNLLLLLQRRHHHKHFLKFIMKKSLPLICHSIPLSPPGVATVMFFPLTALRRNAFFCCLHAFYKRYSMNTGCTRVGYPACMHPSKPFGRENEGRSCVGCSFHYYSPISRSFS